MNSKMLMEVSEYLKAQANVMAAVEQLNPQGTEAKPTNIFTPQGPVTDPGNPGFRGSASIGKDWRDIHGNLLGSYQLGDGNQLMLRKEAMNRNLKDLNTLVRERNIPPKFPNERQEYEA